MASKSGPKKPKASSRKATTDTSTTGAPTPKAKRPFLKKASPDAAIFSVGFVAGGTYSRNSPRTPATNAPEDSATEQPNTVSRKEKS